MDSGFFSVVVPADRLRELRIDFNVLCDVEKVTGLNLLIDPQQAMSMQGMRALCWLSWKRTDPKLTLEETGIIVGQYLPAVLVAVTEAMAGSYPKKEDLDTAEDPHPEAALG